MRNSIPLPMNRQASSLRQAMLLATGFAVVKLLLQVAATTWSTDQGYGVFRDELYYLMCGRNLAAGYVDHSPMVALQARVSELLFGRFDANGSLTSLRFFSAVAGCAKVFLTGILTWAVGGRRAAQALAMAAVMAAPIYLGIDGFLSMNSFEPLFWTTAVLAIVLMVNGGTPRWWLVFGASAGLGIENKPSIVFFLVSLLLGLLLTPQRNILFGTTEQRRCCLLGVGLSFLLAFPYFLWQVQHHLALLEFLLNGKHEHKNVALPPMAFLLAQIRGMNPLSFLLWGAGLVWTLAAPSARQLRWIGVSFALFLVLMFLLHAKDYYVVPAYPMVMAAGALAWQQLAQRLRTDWLEPAFTFLLLATIALLLPLAQPILKPADYLAYVQALHLSQGNSEKYETGPLPQFFADRFGWQELADKVVVIYNSLSSADKKVVGILCSNYGEASAINVLARQPLPFAASSHNNYFLWGPHSYSGEVMIVINGANAQEMAEYYQSCEAVGRMDHPLAMPFERQTIWLCRHRKHTLTETWDESKRYI